MTLAALDKLSPLKSGDCLSLGINCSSNPSAIATFILRVIAPLLIIAAIVFVAALIYGGTLYIISTGEEDKARRAKLIVIFALVGLLIIGIAGIVVNTIIGVIV